MIVLLNKFIILVLYHTWMKNQLGKFLAKKEG